MTEEIIIDGINVAGCKHYRGKYFSDNEYKDCALYENKGFCEEGNCYYKQLKRLEQENKELKKENENYKLYGSSTIVAPVNHTNTEYDLLYGQSMLYKSALEEIRQINNKWLKRWMNDSDELMGFEEIGNKLNEVLK